MSLVVSAASSIGTGLATGIGGALVGGLLGGSGGGDSPSGSMTSTYAKDPWAPAQPYLLGSTTRKLKAGIIDTGNNPESDYETTTTPGVLPEAQNLYGQSQWSPSMQSLLNTQQSILQYRKPVQDVQIANMAGGLLSGQYDPNVQRVGSISGAPTITPQNVNAQSVDPTSAFGSMGAANPTQSIQQMLTGQVNTSTLDPVIQNAQRRLGENFSEQVMPQIRSGAQAAGQYGGSRQGIAEGLASKGLAYSMGDLSANMNNSAYNQAQSNMYGTSNTMAGLGLSNAQGNATRDLSAQTTNAANNLTAQSQNASNALNTQQYNGNIGIQNNSQAMANSQQQVANRVQGLNTMQGGNTLDDQNYQQQMGLLQAPNTYNQGALTNYANVVGTMAGQGNTQNSTNPYYTNTAGNILGGASDGLAIGQKIGGLFGNGNTAYGTAQDATNAASNFTNGWNSSNYG